MAMALRPLPSDSSMNSRIRLRSCWRSTRRRRCRRSESRGTPRWPVLPATRVGGHLIGRFCRSPPPPAAGRPDGDARRLQVCPGRFAADAGFFLNSPQRPAQPAQRDDLLLFLVAQDIAHVDGGYPSARESMSCRYSVGRFSGDPHWPVLGVPRGWRWSLCSGPQNAPRLDRRNPPRNAE